MPDRNEKTRPTSTKSLGTCTTGSSRIASNSSSVISSVNSPSKAPVSLRESMRRAIKRNVLVSPVFVSKPSSWKARTMADSFSVIIENISSKRPRP